MKKILCCIAAIMILSSAKADQLAFYTDADVAIFNDYVSKFKDKRDMEMGQLVVETGKYFVGTPYVNFTLEVREPEALIVNLRELDCVTFVETVISLARTLKSGDTSFDNYCANLQKVRFRNGEIINFTSRLHYFSDWIYDNQQKGVVKDITKTLGGAPYLVHPKIMSRYPLHYRQMVNNPELVPVMAQIEDSIASRKLYSIPRTMPALDSRLKNGYLLGTTTNTTIDVSHCGFTVMIGGKAHFMHASSKEKKVVITEVTLSQYLKSVKSMTGIMVAQVL